MTIVVQNPEPSKGGRPVGSRGNGKTMKEIVAREQRKLAVIEMETRATEARAAAEDINKITALRAEQKARKLSLYEEQEAKRAPQFQIDQRPTLIGLAALAVVTFITSAILSADGTIGAGEAARFVHFSFGFILFGALEVAILAFMLMYYVNGSRVDHDGNPVRATQWFVAMIAAATVTVGLSVYHVLDLYAYDWLNIDMWVGIGIRLTVAVFFVIVSKGLATVLFAKAVRL